MVLTTEVFLFKILEFRYRFQTREERHCGAYPTGRIPEEVSVASGYVASVSRKLNDTREFCNVTPSPPSLHSVVFHPGREALIHMPHHSKVTVRILCIHARKSRK